MTAGFYGCVNGCWTGTGTFERGGVCEMKGEGGGRLAHHKGSGEAGLPKARPRMSRRWKSAMRQRPKGGI